MCIIYPGWSLRNEGTAYPPTLSHSVTWAPEQHGICPHTLYTPYPLPVLTVVLLSVESELSTRAGLGTHCPSSLSRKLWPQGASDERQSLFVLYVNSCPGFAAHSLSDMAGQGCRSLAETGWKPSPVWVKLTALKKMK